MGTKIFVGNLSFNTSEADLTAHFAQAGFEADKVTIVNDRETGRSRGFGFVEMATAEQAASAMSALDGQERVLARLALVHHYAVEETRAQDELLDLEHDFN